MLGVRRSGTTLLRVMLDRHPRLAVPDESYFVPQLARRHQGPIDPQAFVEDLRRLPTLREWRVRPDEVAQRLRAGMSTGDAIAAVYETYAASRGKERWGDKTPMYMEHVGALERLWPHACYVHLIRDGRDAAVSFLSMPKGVVTKTWAHPRSAADFACQWRREVRAARALGRRAGPERYLELRYEELVRTPENELRRICEFASLPYEDTMLEYVGNVDLSAKPHQQSLAKAPTPGLRNWRKDLAEADALAFEQVAGDLLADLGYDVTSGPGAGSSVGGSVRRARYAALTTAWSAAAAAAQRSPLWRRRHPPVS